MRATVVPRLNQTGGLRRTPRREPAASQGIYLSPGTPNAMRRGWSALCWRMTMVRKLLTLFAVTTSLALGACNTVKGVGEDVKSVGEAGDKAV